MAHGEHELGAQIPCMGADDCHSQDAIFAGRHQDLHETLRAAVRDRAVEILDAVLRDLKGDLLRARLLFTQANPGDFRIDERGPRHDRIIRLELLESAEQAIDRCVPGLMRGGMGELIRSRDIARRENSRIDRFEIFVGFYRPVGRDTEFPETEAFDPSDSADWPWLPMLRSPRLLPRHAASPSTPIRIRRLI